jgi:hypothetical protein
MGTGAGIAVETTPASPEPAPEAPSITAQAVEGMLPGSVIQGIDAVTAAAGIPWYVYGLGGVLALGGMWVAWRIVAQGASVALPLAIGGELGTVMALQRLAQLTGGSPPGESRSGGVRLARRPRASAYAPSDDERSDDELWENEGPAPRRRPRFADADALLAEEPLADEWPSLDEDDREERATERDPAPPTRAPSLPRRSASPTLLSHGQPRRAIR